MDIIRLIEVLTPLAWPLVLCIGLLTFKKNIQGGLDKWAHKRSILQ